MTRIAALSLDQAPAGSRAALEGIQKGLGFIPNVFKTLAHSPAALSGYQSLAQALGKTSLSAVEREVVALAASEVNGCDYCVAAHAFFGAKAGTDHAVNPDQLFEQHRRYRYRLPAIVKLTAISVAVSSTCNTKVSPCC